MDEYVEPVMSTWDVTCHVEDCLNNGITIRLMAEDNIAPLTPLISCGPCTQLIHDIVAVIVDETPVTDP